MLRDGVQVPESCGEREFALRPLRLGDIVLLLRSAKQSRKFSTWAPSMSEPGLSFTIRFSRAEYHRQPRRLISSDPSVPRKQVP